MPRPLACGKLWLWTYDILDQDLLDVWSVKCTQTYQNQHFCASNIKKKINMISLTCMITWIFSSILHSQPCILESIAVPISLLALSRGDGLRPKPLWGLSILPGTDILPGPAPPVPLPSPWGLVASECPVPLNLTEGGPHKERDQQIPKGKRK